MKKVYIAGKLNAMACDYIRNVHEMLMWSEKIRKLGFAVYVPCIDFLQGLMFGNWEYNDYFKNSQPFLKSCDAVFVCPDSNGSKGTQREIATALELKIPVYHEIEDLKKWECETPPDSRRAGTEEV